MAARCEDCGRFVAPTAYDKDELFWTGHKTFRCDPCWQNAWEATEEAKDQREYPLAENE